MALLNHFCPPDKIIHLLIPFVLDSLLWSWDRGCVLSLQSWQDKQDFWLQWPLSRRTHSKESSLSAHLLSVVFFLILKWFHHSEEKGALSTNSTKQPLSEMGVFSVPEISVIDNRDYAFGLMTGILGICCRAAYSHLLAKPLMWRTSVISRTTEQNENIRTIGTCTSLASRQKRQINALNLQMWACILGLVTAKGLSLRNVLLPHIITAALCLCSSFVEDSASTSCGVKGWTLRSSVRGASLRQKLPLFSNNRGATFRFLCVGSLLHSSVS